MSITARSSVRTNSYLNYFCLGREMIVLGSSILNQYWKLSTFEEIKESIKFYRVKFENLEQFKIPGDHGDIMLSNLG